MAAREIKQIQLGPHNQTRSIINKDNLLTSIHIPENSRRIRDEIRSNSPTIAEKAKQELMTARLAIAIKKQKPVIPIEKIDYSQLVAVV